MTEHHKRLTFIPKLSKRTNLPFRCILLSVTVPALLALINIGSSTALNDLVSVVTSGYYGSYLVATTLLLWRRCTGAIHTGQHHESNSIVNNVGKELVWGPWRIKGLLGILINLTACLYLILALFWSFWPSETPVTAANMNYNCLIFGAVILLATAYYWLVARTEYKGPIIEAQPSDSEEEYPDK